MVIKPGPELEAALNEQARRKGTTGESLALETLRHRFLGKTPPVPTDEWERRLADLAKDCGVSLSNESLSRDAIYD